MPAESHLARFVAEIPQPIDFIVTNVQQSETIFNVASQYAIATEMLSEITNLSENIQTNDGIYDAQELGVSHLNATVPASNDSIESCFMAF